jgi:hypothetical protein
VCGLGRAYLSFGRVDLADVGEALCPQQFPDRLRRDTSPGVLLESDRGDLRRRFGGDRISGAAQGDGANPAGGPGECYVPSTKSER